MKKRLLIILLLPFLSFGQVQIGQDIDGEAAGDFSGRSISLSSDGSIVAIGAPFNGGNGNNSGHVRVYENINSIWTQIGQDIDGEITGDSSGLFVSLSSDGSIVAIGAINNDGNGNLSGHVRVYENQNDSWTQIGEDIDGEDIGDRLGNSVSLSSDGSIVAIGAPFNDDNGDDSGHVRVYENQNGNWTQIGEDINGEAEGDFSGSNISLSSNGNIVAIGAVNNDGNGDNSGHVRVYENQNSSWTQIGEDIDGEAQSDGSGVSVSLSSDGDVVAIGANLNSNLSGHVRVYENQNGNWTQIGEDIDAEVTSDFSGVSISLSSNGDILAIGSTFNDGNGEDSGHVRIYENQNEVWIQVGEDIDGEAIGDRSGRSVSLSSDGSIVGISARLNDGNGEDSGHVRVFDLSAVLSKEEVTQSQFSIYPNPASTTITIQLDQNSTLQKTTIYNSLGQIVKTSIETTMSTSDLSKGIYILEVITNQGKASKRLIVD